MRKFNVLKNPSSSHFVWKWPIISGGIALIMLFHVIPVWAEYGGVIEAFTCSYSDFVWKRGLETKKVSIFSKLQTGDKIRVKRGTSLCSITLKLTNNQLLTLKNKDGIHRVSVLHNDDGVLDGLYNATASWLGNLWGGKSDKEIIAAARSPRNNKLVIPLLDGGNQKLVVGTTGKRDLYLGWGGGTPPYKVSVKQSFGSYVIKDKTEQHNFTMLKEVNLEKDKTYRVTVSDARGDNVSRTFMVIYSPSFFKGIQNFQKLHPKRRVAWAEGLINDGRSEWGFEAYQQVAGIKKDDPNARRLGIVLEEGL